MNVRDFKRITKEHIIWTDTNGNVKRYEPDETKYHVVDVSVDYENKQLLVAIEHINKMII